MSGLSPISFQFIAAGIATQARVKLCRFQPSQQGEAPSWDGRGESLKTGQLTVPVTDKSYWSGRYALTEINLETEDGEKLTVNDAVVSISQTKNIVKTALVGLNGTIKEYINAGDYEISIMVGIVATEVDGTIVDEYPEEGIRTVKKFLDENRAVQVSSPFFDIFGISRMVVEKFSLAQETHSNRQVVDVRAVSDEDYEIKCTEY